MGIGGGFLKQMNDTIKYNRDLLGKKKSLREIYRDEVKKTPSRFNQEQEEHVRARVAKAIRRNKTVEWVARIGVFSIVSVLIVTIVWVVSTTDFSVKQENSLRQPDQLFGKREVALVNGLTLRQEFFLRGSIAAETHFKNGLKHQHAESYYPTGEQFRSALYYYDTLIREIYFFKNGDTIHNFPVITDKQVHKLMLTHEKSGARTSILFYDGKIIPDHYWAR